MNKKTENKVVLPKDELPHDGQAIEWWYFNGFLKGKHRYSFMTCLFKADKEKVNLKFLKLPVKTIYFSHSLLFDLDTGKIEKEVLPFVIMGKDNFDNGKLKINYFYPLRTEYFNYEITRIDEKIRLKTKYFDLMLEEKKRPLLEGGKGFIDLGTKSTYYFSYSNLEAKGYVKDDKVTGKAWHDKQWSEQGFMKDYWLWFSFQMEDNTEIVCFDYKGTKMATISYPDNSQETVPAEFNPQGRLWKSPRTDLKYQLSWNIKVKNFEIKTAPMMKDCEMSFGFINYWEGPLDVKINGKKAKGFMEFLSNQKTSKIKNLYENFKKEIKKYF